MKFIKSAILAATLAIAGSAAVAAPIYTVNYTVTDSVGGYWGAGSFAGTDANSDGILSLVELIAFNGSDNVENQHVALDNLSGFGTFDISANVWSSNGFGWGFDDFAYFSWNGSSNSVNSLWAQVATSVSSSDVPEPASVALLGLGIAGLFASRRRKQA